ncbi:MAG: hypothetical protein RR574_10395, partial [Comamonas sp.]
MNEITTAKGVKDHAIQARGVLGSQRFQEVLGGKGVEVNIECFMCSLLIAVEHLHHGLCFWVG